MKKFYLYCDGDKAYEALINNGFLCRGLTDPETQIPSTSFVAEYSIFLSCEKLNEKGRSYGVSGQNNQYPVSFEISGIEDYNLQCRFLIRENDGQYRLSDKFLPVDQFGAIDDCVGLFAVGLIPFSLVTRILFENQENRERFYKSGADLWFPEELYALWTDDNYSDLPKRTIDSGALREAAIRMDNEIGLEELDKIKQAVLNRFHAKAACYKAIEATKMWRANRIRTNADNTIIRLLDGPSGLLREQESNQVEKLSSFFSFVNPSFLSEIDPALDDTNSNDSIIFQIVVKSMADNGYKLDKDTVSLIQSRINERYFTKNLLEPSPVSNQIESISTYLSSWKNDVEVMLEQTKGNDVLYALALCIKSRGDADKIKNETAEMSQRVRRYVYIISGFASGMGFVLGKDKSNMLLEKRISDRVSTWYPDIKLIQAKAVDDGDCGFIPEVFLSISGQEYKEAIEQADEDRLENIYHAEFTDLFDISEVSSYKNPIVLEMKNSTWTIKDEEDVNQFRKDIKDFCREAEQKIGRRKKEFNKALFLKKVTTDFKGRLNAIYDKYRGNLR